MPDKIRCFLRRRLGVRSRRSRRPARQVSVSLAVLGLATVAIPAVATADPGPASFSYTGAEQAYTVPADVIDVSITAVGAPGGPGTTWVTGAGGAGAFGAVVSGQVAVTPGEVLYVEVGGAGTDGGHGGLGGFNGGGSATAPGEMGGSGGGGGGASDVRTCSRYATSCLDGSQDTLHSRLLVAGGGGGGSAASGSGPGASGGAGGTTDGQPGSDGTGTTTAKGYGGGGGTLIAGGAGGVSGANGALPCDNSDAPGADGSFGAGGAAGAGDPYGGGGGGGYWGGGGGGNGCDYQTRSSSGGGGGGGSSFGPAGLAAAVDTSGVPAVTITPVRFAPNPPPTAPLPAPAARVNSAGLSFSSQAVGSTGAPQTVTIENVGSAALHISDTELEGADPSDFIIGSSTCDAPVLPGSSCDVAVRFAPLGGGARTATLAVMSDDPSGAATLSLSGTGLASQAPTGAGGAGGARGQQGRPGQIVLVSCRTVLVRVNTGHHGHRALRVARRVCRSRSVSGSVTFTSTGLPALAAISRGGVVYATGDGVARGSRGLQLTLYQSRPMPPGRYTLTLRSRTQQNPKQTRITRTSITIASGGRNAA